MDDIITYYVIENGAIANVIEWDSEQFPEFGEGKHIVKLVTTNTMISPKGITRDPEDPEGNSIPDELHQEHVCTDMVHGKIFHPTETPSIGDFYGPGKFIPKNEE